MKDDQKEIYYASGESLDKIKMLPQVEMLIDKGYEVLYLTEYLDEFVIKMLNQYQSKNFINVTDKNLDLDTKEEKYSKEAIHPDVKEMLNISSPEILKDFFLLKNLN